MPLIDIGFVLQAEAKGYSCGYVHQPSTGQRKASSLRTLLARATIQVEAGEGREIEIGLTYFRSLRNKGARDTAGLFLQIGF